MLCGYVRLLLFRFQKDFCGNDMRCSPGSTLIVHLGFQVFGGGLCDCSENQRYEISVGEQRMLFPQKILRETE